MTHPGEGTLQALLDDELPVGERVRLERHLAGCAECARELDGLHSTAAAFSAALLHLDTAPQVEQARWRFEGRRRRHGARGAGVALRRAAVLIVGSAAVLSATVPGSPVREWLAERWERGAVVSTTDAPEAAPTTPAAAPAPEAVPAGVSVRPLEGRMRVVFVDPAAGVRLRVRLHDGERVGVWASPEAAGAHFRTAPDRIEVDGVPGGEVRVELPRAGHEFILEVNGHVYLRKEGEHLRFPGPAADTSGPEILFEVGA